MDPSKTESQPPTALSPSVSPWTTYFTGKKMGPDAVFKQVDRVTDQVDHSSGKPVRKKIRRIIRPDESERNEIVEALLAQPDRIERLLLMLHAAASASDAIRGIVMELTEIGLVRLGVLSSTEQLDETSFGQAASSWLAGTTEGPLHRSTLDRLLVLLLYGWHRQFLDQNAVRGFLCTVAERSKVAAPKKQVGKSPPRLLQAMIAARRSEAVLQAMLAYVDEARAEQLHMDTEMCVQGEQIVYLQGQNASLKAENSDLTAQIEALRAQKEAAESTSASLQKQVEDTRAGYQHKLDDVRGHIRGTLEGQLSRWLETGLDASRANPPRAEVIEERLEEALKLIEKELRWLQPSA